MNQGLYLVKNALNKLKCLIIDDDPLITDLVMHFSEKSERIEYCVSCNDPIEGIKLLSNGKFDLLFLDYNMPLLNGKELLDVKKDNSKVIMITSNTKFAVESYDYEVVVDYMVKPLHYDRFEKALNKAFPENFEENKSEPLKPKKSILVKDGNSWIPVLYENILFIKSDSNYCIFHTINEKIMSLTKLKDLEEKLPSNFIRCHRSYIVNVDFINKVNLEEIEIQETTIPVSEMYKVNIKKFLEGKN